MTDNPYIIDVTGATFDSEVLARSHALPVLVDFWAGWCAPCKMLMPILAKLATDLQGKFVLAKVDTDQEQKLAGAWQVRSLPTVKLFVNGAVVEEFMGVQPENAIRALLERYLRRPSDQLAEQAARLHAAGNDGEALALLRQAMAEDSENTRLAPQLLALLVQTGQYDEARAALHALPLSQQTDAQLVSLGARLDIAMAARDAGDKSTLMQQIAADDGNLDARFSLACRYVMEEDYEAALALLLEILRRNKSYKEGLARESVLKIFTIIGTTDPLVGKYRPQLAKILL